MTDAQALALILRSFHARWLDVRFPRRMFFRQGYVRP